MPRLSVITPCHNAGNYVGSEVDFIATWNVTKWLQLEGGYSHFFTGEFIRKTGPDKNSDFLYAAMQYTF